MSQSGEKRPVNSEANIEELKSLIQHSYQDALKLVQERGAQKLVENKENAIFHIKDFISEIHESNKRNPLLRKFAKWLTGKGKRENRENKRDNKAELPVEKMRRFYEFFEGTVFSSFVHGTSLLIEDGILKSPQLIADEKGVDIKDSAKNSGKKDIEIGNTSYVFAVSSFLRTRSSGGKYKYRIDSQDGFAVTLDIADTHYPDQPRLSSDDYDKLQIIIYSRNIFTITDFKDFFAWYSIAFFDRPEDALSFYQRNSFWLQKADRWDEDSYPMEINLPWTDEQDVQDGKIRSKMRMFFLKTLIQPPILPEFQFRNKVQGRLIEDNRLEY